MTRAGREIAVQGLCLASGHCTDVAHTRSTSTTDDSIRTLVSGRRTERATEVDTSTTRLHTRSSASHYFAGWLDVSSD